MRHPTQDFFSSLLEPYYTQAEWLYQVHGERGEDPSEPPASAPYPFPAVSHEPRLQQLSEDFAQQGLKPFHTPLGIMLDEANPHLSKCIRCNTCDGFPCLVHAKADAEVIAVNPALEHKNVTLLTKAYVERLETSPVRTRSEQGDRAARRPSRGVFRSHCRAFLRRNQLRRLAVALRQREAPSWTG